MSKHVFHCDSCKRNLHYESDFTTGYGTDPETNDKVCYPCCAQSDLEYMQEHGKIALYLTQDDDKWKVTNWPGSLMYDNHGRGLYVSVGRHNIASKRYDTWFRGPSGYIWHGVRYGDNTEIVHCKRTKSTTF